MASPVLRMRVAVVAILALGLATACTSTAGGRRSTSDDRVRSFMGEVPPELPSTGTWTNVGQPTSLAALRGRVVYLQFAFPT
ncbi:MAG: hypothetical protein ACYTG6_04545 [Planctomycetota bacterium]|jgi:hypothetical protein